MRKLPLLMVVAVATAALGVAMHRMVLVHELRKPLLAHLENPEDPEFKNEVYSGDWTVAGGTLCGQASVARPNRSTEGFQWFSVSNGVFIENDVLRRQFDGAGIKRCDFAERPPEVPWWWLAEALTEAGYPPA